MSEHNINKHEKQLQESRQYWDDLAFTFDDEPDHGLRDPIVLDAWTQLLKAWLPSTQAEILDIGCGTGSLSVVLAGLRHTVTGIDVSPSMITLAQTKAKVHGYPIKFQVMDARCPNFRINNSMSLFAGTCFGHCRNPNRSFKGGSSS